MTFRYENQKYKQGYSHVIGCDEVGRGCLAGPVVAAAVVLLPVKSGKYKVKSLAGVRDSKLLSPEKREELDSIIKDSALAWGIGVVDERTIDKINIHRASLMAMRWAVENVEARLGVPFHDGMPQSTAATFLCVDGKFPIPGLKLDQQPIIDGDNKILSIAAASIIAKVYRDNLMRKLHQQYPIYNFYQHKGYATLFHRTAILRHGLSPIHRLSFCGHLGSKIPIDHRV